MVRSKSACSTGTGSRRRADSEGEPWWGEDEGPIIEHDDPAGGNDDSDDAAIAQIDQIGMLEQVVVTEPQMSVQAGADEAGPATTEVEWQPPPSRAKKKRLRGFGY